MEKTQKVVGLGECQAGEVAACATRESLASMPRECQLAFATRGGLLRHYLHLIGNAERLCICHAFIAAAMNARRVNPGATRLQTSRALRQAMLRRSRDSSSTAWAHC